MAKRVIFKVPATLSFPHLDKAQAPRNGMGAAKFSAAFLFYPISGDEYLMANGKGYDVTAAQITEQKKALDAALLEAAEEVFGTKAAGMLKSKSLKYPIRDDAEAKGYPEGTIYFNAQSSNAPGLVYPWADPETKKAAKVPQDKIAKVFYPGARVIASVTAFYYDNESKGVTFGLNNVQLIGDGPRLDSQKSAEDEFAADSTLTPADLATLEG